MNSLVPKMAGALLALAVACNPVLAHSGGHHHSMSTSSGSHSKTIHVSGYVHSHATHVAHHVKATPHHTPTVPKVTAGSHHAASTAHHSSVSHRTHYYGERDAHGRFIRSTKAKDAFKLQHPCPSTGMTSGPCPGYVIDHVIPLKRGARDAPSNMQCQTAQAAKAKDKIE